MLRLIWDFVNDKQFAIQVLKIAASLVMSAALNGAFDQIVPAEWLALLVGLSYGGNALLAGQGRKKKNGDVTNGG